MGSGWVDRRSVCRSTGSEMSERSRTLTLPSAWASRSRRFGAGGGVFKMVPVRGATFAPSMLTWFGRGRSVHKQSFVNTPSP